MRSPNFTLHTKNARPRGPGAREPRRTRGPGRATGPPPAAAPRPAPPRPRAPAALLISCSVRAPAGPPKYVRYTAGPRTARSYVYWTGSYGIFACFTFSIQESGYSNSYTRQTISNGGCTQTHAMTETARRVRETPQTIIPAEGPRPQPGPRPTVSTWYARNAHAHVLCFALPRHAPCRNRVAESVHWRELVTCERLAVHSLW